jgi:hypothetical protein
MGLRVLNLFIAAVSNRIFADLFRISSGGEKGNCGADDHFSIIRSKSTSDLAVSGGKGGDLSN